MNKYLLAGVLVATFVFVSATSVFACGCAKAQTNNSGNNNAQASNAPFWTKFIPKAFAQSANATSKPKCGADGCKCKTGDCKCTQGTNCGCKMRTNATTTCGQGNCQKAGGCGCANKPAK